MTEIAEKLKIELARLSLQDRAELAHFLIRSLDEEMDDDAESAWDGELTRRMQEINQGTASAELANNVFIKLREKYS